MDVKQTKFVESEKYTYVVGGADLGNLLLQGDNLLLLLQPDFLLASIKAFSSRSLLVSFVEGIFLSFSRWREIAAFANVLFVERRLANSLKPTPQKICAKR
jgi:hypothetical protein